MKATVGKKISLLMWMLAGSPGGNTIRKPVMSRGPVPALNSVLSGEIFHFVCILLENAKYDLMIIFQILQISSVVKIQCR